MFSQDQGIELPAKVHVWGVIKKRSPTRLDVFPGSTRIYSNTYCRVIERLHIPINMSKYGGYARLVQDKAAAILLEEYSGFGRHVAATLAVVRIDRGRSVAGVGRRCRRCRRQRRPTVAAVVDTGDRRSPPSPLSSTTATDRRRCRRQQRPTVAAVVAVVDTPSSIPTDDSGDDRGDKDLTLNPTPPKGKHGNTADIK
ncbi:hypothetical protein Y032_0266g691 [Ancylostoma ceylanicum]|uniref:Uncharacterized protein n=1 Tax=Ancylostoma ceylanicum TaxID=53326 RepID=A0A016SA96_9BILA|nr:hypothetical protein Y032_0266g691 [Ancylostoma ceylanicum]